MYDLIIKGGSVIDGTGKPAYVSDIGVKKGKIHSIGPNLEGAKCVIDAAGLTVTPGFIDSHSHADSKILDCPDQKEKLEQGVTTSVAGQCGGSAAPQAYAPDGIHESFISFFEAVSKKDLGSNFLCFVGHGTVRRCVIGNENRTANDEEIARMKDILRDAFEQGAAGLSFGLFYAPGSFSDKNEAIALAKVAKEYGRPVSAHIRSESDDLIEATEEFIDIIRSSGCRGVLSHHKAVQRRNWGKVNKTLEMLQAAVSEGVDIYCDVYPYCASSTTFSQAFVPGAWRDGGTKELINRISDPVLNNDNKKAFYEKHGADQSWILVSSCPGHREYEGLTLDLIANDLGMDPYDAAMKLIIDSNDACKACFFSVSEDDLKKVMSWERTMICTDSGMAGDAQKFHPRMIGSFPRAIGRYVRQQQVVSLEEMVRKMTSLPAYVYCLTGKGQLAEGYDADICVFDSKAIIDKADFVNCDSRAEGLRYVIVEGHIVAENAVHNGTNSGKLIRA